MRGNPYRAVFANVGGNQVACIAQLVSPVGFGALGLEQPVILIVRPDRKLPGLVALHHGQGAEVGADAGGPKSPDFLAMEGWMVRVAQRAVLACESA